MSYTALFYWLTVADNAKEFFGWFALFFIVIFVVTQLVRFFTYMESDLEPGDTFIKRVNTWTWYSTPLMLLFMSLWIFTPNKKDALLIIAGGQTVEFLMSDSASRQIPAEVMNFVLVELQFMAKDAEVDLGIVDTKEKILNKAKEMTTEELLDLMKSNEEFRELLLK